MNNSTFQELEKSISSNRLQTYKSLSIPTDNEKTIANYIYNTRLSENFYLLLQNLEVTLRNAIYDGYNNHMFRRSFFI